jgi:hypothetical protein
VVSGLRGASELLKGGDIGLREDRAKSSMVDVGHHANVNSASRASLLRVGRSEVH